MYHISIFPFRNLKARVRPSDVALHNEADATALPCENNEEKTSQRTPNGGTGGMVKVKSLLSCQDMARWVWFFLRVYDVMIFSVFFTNILVAKVYVVTLIFTRRSYLPLLRTEVPPVLFGGVPSRFWTIQWSGEFRWFTRFQIQFPGRCSQHSQVQWSCLCFF